MRNPVLVLALITAFGAGLSFAATAGKWSMSTRARTAVAAASGLTT